METYTKKNSDSHVILYAKHHYKRNDMISDLKQIYSLRNGIDEEHINKLTILTCLLHLVESLQDPKFETHITLSDFISDINPDNIWKIGYRTQKEYDFELACIYKCLSVICMARVFEKDGKVLIELDEANENVLPLAKS